MSVPPRPGVPRPVRPPAVAGQFYPAAPGELGTMVDDLFAEAASSYPTPAGVDAAALAGILVPHAGFVYSGIVAGAGWGLARAALARSAERTPTIVLLGTNHGAAWLRGVGAWDAGPWWTPLGEVAIDDSLTRAVLDLGPPFAADARCHVGEHSLEVQLPFVARRATGVRIVALSVGTGTGPRTIEAGGRLGSLLAARRSAGEPILLAISSDMAHYPTAVVAERVTAVLLPRIIELDSDGLARDEADAIRRQPGVSCGMCGIAPTILGLAALRAMGVTHGTTLAQATSADSGGDPNRTVGYLAVGFGAG